MSLREITGTALLLPQGLKEGVSVCIEDESGRIIRIQESTTEAEFFSGIISPGFINAHCHLELSGLKGQIPQHTGMAGFIRTLQGVRDSFKDEELCLKAAQDMFQSGIQAVADISNSALTAPLKAEVRRDIPRFHTFLEVFGLKPEKSQEILKMGQEKTMHFPEASCSLTWHAPYSSSPQLIKSIGNYAQQYNQPYSLHLLESEEEINLFQSRSGPLAALFQEWGFQPLPDWFGNIPVLDFLLPLLPREIQMIWVHGVFLNPEGIQKIVDHIPQSYFCLCPSANEYIHHSLPPVLDLLPYSDRIVLGTDSLAGNESLDLLNDLKILSTHFPSVSTEELLFWATRNGAVCMGWNDLGTLEVGKSPGLIQIDSLQQGRIFSDTFVKRIV
jgi:cytosine/adenosine deaminase-related metal-dependent hydrolase